VLKIGGLTPNTHYRLTLRDEDGNTIDERSTATAPLPRTDDTIKMVFAGEIPTLDDQSSLALFSAATQVSEPDLVCWLGNGLSSDGLRWTSGSAYRNAALAFAQTEALSLLGKAYPQLHVFSPTDYGPLGSSRHWSGRTIALQSYRDFWPAPLQPFPEVPGIYQMRYGDVEFFALDPLSQRDGFETPAARATVFSREQLDWLVNALATSDATFKLILSPMSLLHPRSDEASLAHYKRAKEDFHRALREPPTEGILIVSASDGPGELTRSVRPDGYPLFELSVRHLIHLSELPKMYPEDNYFRVPGTLVREPHYTSLTASGELNSRQLTINFHRLDSSVIRSESVSGRDLRD
jgi:alkaline phosphatase D|tara:strand:- start:21529 stop:22581 length:1053 start_codon:yes stop_codon:yes gene_type:complete